MPLYEYFCKDCGLKFEELVFKVEGSETHQCPSCNNPKASKLISTSSFKLNGEGFHRNDYPSIDQAVGASAERRWSHYHTRKAEKDKIRKESSTNALVLDEQGSYSPADPTVVPARNKMGNEFTTALKEHREDRAKKGIPQSDTLKPE